MIENTEDKNLAAEERRQDTKRFVRQVRSATRRKYTPEEKIHIVLQGFRAKSPSTSCAAVKASSPPTSTRG